MPYPLPPWLTPKSDPASEYAASFRQTRQLQAQMASEQARLAASADQSAAEMAMRQQLAEREAQLKQEQLMKESALKQQEMAMTKAYQEANVGLKTQEVQQAQQELAMKATETARKYAAQRAFQQEIGEGTDMNAVTRAIIKYGPMMGEPGTATSAAIRASMTGGATLPGSVATVPVTDYRTGLPLPGAFAYPSAGGRGLDVHWQGTDPMERMLTMNMLTSRESDLRALRKEHSEDSRGKRLSQMDTPPKGPTDKLILQDYQDRQERIGQLETEIKELQSSGRGGRLSPPGATTRTTGAAGARVFQDASGARYRYVGTSADPLSDEDAANWQPF